MSIARVIPSTNSILIEMRMTCSWLETRTGWTCGVWQRWGAGEAAMKSAFALAREHDVGAGASAVPRSKEGVAAMQGGDFAHERQAEPRTAGTVGPWKGIEAFEDA